MSSLFSVHAVEGNCMNNFLIEKKILSQTESQTRCLSFILIFPQSKTPQPNVSFEYRKSTDICLMEK